VLELQDLARPRSAAVVRRAERRRLVRRVGEGMCATDMQSKFRSFLDFEPVQALQ